MKKVCKFFAIALIIGITASGASTMVHASETFIPSASEETCYATNEVTGETSSNKLRGTQNTAEFTHTFGVHLRTKPYASDHSQKQSYCKTTYKKFAQTKKDSYSRACMEKGALIKADPGRKYDSRDGAADGKSAATSLWLDTQEGYTGRTYYGY